MTNWALKQLIGEKFGTQQNLAMETDIDPARITGIVRGYFPPSAFERKALRRALGLAFEKALEEGTTKTQSPSEKAQRAVMA